MQISQANLETAFRGFKSIYQDSFANAPVYWPKLAMKIPSGSREENYGWLGNFPQLREWLDGERVIKSLSEHGFKIVNRRFESTVSITRMDFSDDRYGLFSPMFSEMGALARQHPDTILFDLIAGGFTTNCYDGQNFFDSDHPMYEYDAEHPSYVQGGNNTVVHSNMDDGTAPAWYLLDCSRTIKPFIWQEREVYDFRSLFAPNDSHVFMKDEYLYGVRARVNAGLGLWQLAYGSKLPLTKANYEKARKAMMQVRGDTGRLLGVKPDTLVVSAEIEGEGRRLLKATTNGGEANEWAGSAELVVAPYLD